MGSLLPSSTALKVSERLGSAGFLSSYGEFVQPQAPQAYVDLSQSGSPPASSSQSAYWNSQAVRYDISLGAHGRPLTRAAKAEGSTPVCSRKRQASVTFSEGDQFTSDQDEEPKAKRSRRKVSVPTTDASGRPLPKEEIRRAKRRITNRESARRMRQERQVKAEDTVRKMNFLEETNVQLRQQVLYLQGALRQKEEGMRRVQEENHKYHNALCQAVALNEQRQFDLHQTGVQGLMPAPGSPISMPVQGHIISASAALPEVLFSPHALDANGLLEDGFLACATELAGEETLQDFELGELDAPFLQDDA